ncbi:MAG: DUF4850 domain-containing protein [Proteobacteria bacterium]|nr:DUF4850 domain-containing protein [Pseudomonadota bacterium]
MRSIAAFVLMVSLALSCAAVSAETYHFTLARKAPAAADVPKSKSIGELVVNGSLTMPAYAITVVDGVDGWTTAKPSGMKVVGAKLTAAQASRLAAYSTPSGWMLVPRDWKLLAGGVGADGSTAIVFVPPSGQGYFDFYDASACRGCAETPASLFFPEARADAKRDEYSVYEKSATPLELTRLGKHRMLYRTVVDGQRIDGIAEYDGASDLPYRNWEVSLPAAQRDLATPMLNWFLRAQQSRR